MNYLKEKIKAFLKSRFPVKQLSARFRAIAKTQQALQAKLHAVEQKCEQTKQLLQTEHNRSKHEWNNAKHDLLLECQNIRKELEEERRKVKGLQSNLAQMQTRFQYQFHKYLPQDKYPDALMDWWLRQRGLPLDLVTPRTYNQKVQWIKLFGITPLITELTDKHLVREWVKKKIGEKYLIPHLGCWEQADQIDFARLPDQFVLKANHGCGWNIIVKNKAELNEEEARKKLQLWLSTNYAFYNFELQYLNIRPRIIAETYIENFDGDVFDYKFWCFKGKVHYIQFLAERKKGLKMAFFDREWNLMPFVYSYPQYTQPVEKVENLDEMIEVAEKLAAGFEHARVDLYRMNDGTVKFGEITFTSASGNCRWSPPEWDEKLGAMFDLPKHQ